MPRTSPHILDVTIRDGSYLIQHQFSPEAVAKIATGLAESGIEWAEVSHGCGIGSRMMGMPGRVDDDELLEAAKKAAPSLKLSVFISPNEYSLPLIPGIVEYIDLGRVGVNVDQVPAAAKVIARLKKYGKMVSLQLVRSHSCTPEFAAQAAKQAQDMGADIVYIVDTFGSMAPQDASIYVAALRSEIKAAVGFHGHNHLQMAIPNTLSAFKAGADWLDGSLMGVGRGAGNAVLEAMILLLKNEGFTEQINLEKLCQTTQESVLPIFSFPPYSRAVDIFCAREKIDYTPETFLELVAFALQIPLDRFLKLLRQKMGAQVQLNEEILKQVFYDHGQDWDTMIANIKGNSNGKKANS